MAEDHRDPAAEIEPIMEGLREQVTALLRRRGLLRTAKQTLDVELELAALGRQFADEVMEKLLCASVAAEPAQRSADTGALPPRGEADALGGAAKDDGAATGREAG